MPAWYRIHHFAFFIHICGKHPLRVNPPHKSLGGTDAPASPAGVQLPVAPRRLVVTKRAARPLPDQCVLRVGHQAGRGLMVCRDGKELAVVVNTDWDGALVCAAFACCTCVVVFTEHGTVR